MAFKAGDRVRLIGTGWTVVIRPGGVQGTLGTIIAHPDTGELGTLSDIAADAGETYPTSFFEGFEVEPYYGGEDD